MVEVPVRRILRGGYPARSETMLVCMNNPCLFRKLEVHCHQQYAINRESRSQEREQRYLERVFDMRRIIKASGSKRYKR
jgi:hypothetical protein